MSVVVGFHAEFAKSSDVVLHGPQDIGCMPLPLPELASVMAANTSSFDDVASMRTTSSLRPNTSITGSVFAYKSANLLARHHIVAPSHSGNRRARIAEQRAKTVSLIA